MAYNLRLESRAHHIEATVTVAEIQRSPEIVAWVWEQLERGLADMALPGCVVPGCNQRGRMTFTAAEQGRLAGREWQPGDEIRLCPRHGHDVYRAQMSQMSLGVVQLADWLQPDARGPRPRTLYVTRNPSSEGERA